MFIAIVLGPTPETKMTLCLLIALCVLTLCQSLEGCSNETRHFCQQSPHRFRYENYTYKTSLRGPWTSELDPSTGNRVLKSGLVCSSTLHRYCLSFRYFFYTAFGSQTLSVYVNNVLTNSTSAVWSVTNTTIFQNYRSISVSVEISNDFYFTLAATQNFQDTRNYVDVRNIHVVNRECEIGPEKETAKPDGDADRCVETAGAERQIETPTSAARPASGGVRPQASAQRQRQAVVVAVVTPLAVSTFIFAVVVVVLVCVYTKKRKS